MKSRLFLLIVFCGMLTGAFWLSIHQTTIMEKVANRAAGRYFKNSIRFDHARLDHQLKLHIHGAKGSFQKPEGPYPLEILSIESGNSLANLALHKPVTFIFDGVRLNDSAFKGIKGRVDAGPGRSFRLESEIEGLGLEDVAPLNPGNLKGSSGEMRGKIVLQMKPGSDSVFEAELHAQDQGGRIPSRFFDFFLPYLPAAASRTELETIIQVAGLVAFTEGDLKINTAGPGRIKVFLHMKIPAYNLNLNLNVEIHVDTENIFQAMTQLMQTLGAKTA